MNHDPILSCLVGAGYDAELTDGGSTLTLGFKVGKRRISLVHEFPNEVLGVPKFYLADGYAGKLAHVDVDRNGGPGQVCIADEGATAVNTDRPELVYLETVREHVELLTRLIENPEYNRTEQLREFEAHWEILCRKEGGGFNELFVAWDGQEAESLQVRRPRADSGPAPTEDAHPLAGGVGQPPATGVGPKSRGMGGAPSGRERLGVRVSGLEPAPASRDELLPWYFRAARQADAASRRELLRLHKKSSRDYWLVFSAPIPDGETFFRDPLANTFRGHVAGVGGGGRPLGGDALPGQVAVAAVTGAAGRRLAGLRGEVRSSRGLRVGWQRTGNATDFGWGWPSNGIRSRDVLGGKPLPPHPVGELHRAGPRPGRSRPKCPRSIRGPQ